MLMMQHRRDGGGIVDPKKMGALEIRFISHAIRCRILLAEPRIGLEVIVLIVAADFNYHSKIEVPQ